MNITKISVNHPTWVMVVFTGLIFLGVFSYKSLNYELMPNFSAPVFIVATVYPGASPAEVENGVTKKVEDALSTLENLDISQSISQEGISIVYVSLKLSADVDYALQEAQRKVNIIKNTLPADILEPMISKVSLSDLPILNIGATSTLNSIEFYDLLKHRVLPALNQIQGVGEITLIGGNEREIRVSLDAARLEAYNLSALQVLQAVQSSSLEFPTGKIKNNETQTVIRLSAKFKSIHDIENVVVFADEAGALVKLKNVAEVWDTAKETTSLARVNGINSVGMSIKKQSGANTVEVSHLIKAELIRLEEVYHDENLKFTIPSDASEFIEKAANSVKQDLLNVVLLVSLVMFIFLHSLRNALIVMFVVPISLIVSFVGMYLLGYSLNLMTLLALSLIIGMLVDSAIVALENIHRHLEMGKTRVQATVEGLSQIGFTITASILTNIVVFLPIGLSKSIISPILSPFALVIVMTSFLSLIVAFTVVPLLTSRLARIQHPKPNTLNGRFALWFEKMMDNFASIIRTILVWAFRHKIWTFAIVLILFFGSIALIPAGFVGTEFAGVGDASQVILQVELPKDATLKETNLKILEIEKLLYKKPEVKNVFTTIGSTSNGIFGSEGGAYKAEISVKLVDKEFRDVSSLVFGARIQNELRSQIAGVKIQTARVNTFTGGTDEAPIWIIVQSNDPDSLNRYATKVQNLVEKTPGAQDVKSTIEASGSEISVEIDHEKMAQLGLSLATVGPVMQTAFSGNTDAKFRDGAYEYDINIIFDEFNRHSMADVANLSFINSAGQRIRLSQFAKIAFGTGSTKLERYDRISSVTIQANVMGRAAGDVGEEIKRKIVAHALPPEVTVAYEGEMKYQADAFGNLGLALLTSIFLVYLVMVALYESYLYPFVVLFSIPLAIIGAILALALAKANLSMFSFMGIVMLVGIVGNNAIILVDFANQMKKQGYRTTRALLSAVKLRLRPILMTSMSTVVGFLPIALATGPASEWKNGLAWVLIGGLLSSMLLTLVIVPVVFLIADSLKEKLRAWLAIRKEKIVLADKVANPAGSLLTTQIGE